MIACKQRTGTFLIRRRKSLSFVCAQESAVQSIGSGEQARHVLQRCRCDAFVSGRRCTAGAGLASQSQLQVPSKRPTSSAYVPLWSQVIKVNLSSLACIRAILYFVPSFSNSLVVPCQFGALHEGRRGWVYQNVRHHAGRHNDVDRGEETIHGGLEYWQFHPNGVAEEIGVPGMSSVSHSFLPAHRSHFITYYPQVSTRDRGREIGEGCQDTHHENLIRRDEIFVMGKEHA